MSEQAQRQYEKLMSNTIEKIVKDVEGNTLAETTETAPQTDVNVPLTNEQKLTLTNIRLRRSNIQRQIAELQTQDAKLEGFFHGELTKIAIANKIDMQNFVLSDSLEIKPLQKGMNVPALRA
jgi:hypothetical protein